MKALRSLLLATALILGSAGLVAYTLVCDCLQALQQDSPHALSPLSRHVGTAGSTIGVACDVSDAASPDSLSCRRRSLPKPPPNAERRPVSLTLHNTTVVDDFGWLRFRSSDPAAARYLDQENEYAKQMLAFGRGSALRAEIVAELEDAPQVPAQRNDPRLPHEAIESFWESGSYLYWITYADGAVGIADTNNTAGVKPFPIYKRRRLDLGSHADVCKAHTASTRPARMASDHTMDEIVLDLNEVIPANSSYWYMGVFEVNPHMEDLLAYSIDLVGSERYTLRFRDIRKGVDLAKPGPISGTYYSARWLTAGFSGNRISGSKAAQWLVYNLIDETFGVPMRIECVCVVHCPNSARPSSPETIYVEHDISFTAELTSSTDNALVFIKIAGQITSDIRLLWWAGDTWGVRALFPREPGVQYEVDHHMGDLLVRTNSGAQFNFYVFRVSLDQLVASTSTLAAHPPVQTQTLVDHSPHTFIERIEAFQTHLLVWIWEDGLRMFAVAELGSDPFELKKMHFHIPDRPDTQVYSIMPGTISDIDARLYRRHTASYFLFTKSSFLEQRTVYCVAMETLDVHQVYRFSSPSLATDYVQERVWASSRNASDPLKIPMSIVYRADRSMPTSSHHGTALRMPALLVAYGAYGSFSETEFSADIFPLLNRGLLFAICHPRGDGDLGAQWYHGGKFEHKANTFSDTRSCVHSLIDQGYATPGLIAIKARSAGGLVAGNAISWSWESQEPLVSVVVAQVPFVDPIFDMVDETVPWTAFEWFEWGNPLSDYGIFASMMKYSPYMTIQTGAQPAILVTAGIQDPRVPFWEPAKYVAKLRWHKTANTRGTAHVHGDARSPGGPAADDVSDTPLLLRIYDAGHFSTQGERARLEELAEWYSFVLQNLEKSRLL